MSIVAESRIPRILESAPDFEAKSTQGVIRLSDYTSKGKYVLLFSHPADFTPVCSTEFIAFAKAWQRFDDLGVQLIGVSIDSLYSHIAWVRDIEEHAGVEIKFPVIARSRSESGEPVRARASGGLGHVDGARGVCHRSQAGHPRHRLYPM